MDIAQGSPLNQAPQLMSKLIYAMALAFLLGWAIGYFLYDSGPSIHILLALSISLVAVGVYREK